MSEKRHAVTVLTMSTIAFTICFACWVINGVLVTFLVDVNPAKYAFTGAEIGWLLALPIFTGAVSRIPLGILTDKFGGRVIFPIVMILTAIPMFLLSFASEYSHFLLASLGFGLAGGSFAVGIGFTSIWFDKNRQGTALGIFGMGNAGAAFTTSVAPGLLKWLTSGGDLERWRLLPKMYAGVLLVMAILFFFLTKNRKVTEVRTLKAQLSPLKSIVVWRFGLYYFLVFGGFVAFAQWLVPYSLNVYELSLSDAGFLATLFILPSGVIRAFGGWLSDKFGARTVMYGVFWSCIFCAVVLSFPRMEILSPGKGVLAKKAGVVTEVTKNKVTVVSKDSKGKSLTKAYKITPLSGELPSKTDKGSLFFPRVTTWQQPSVKKGDKVQKKQLVVAGFSNIYYPSNVWVFGFLVFLFGVATGIGKAAVFKFIPDQFPKAVGAVGGMVGFLGAMGGFILPPLFGYLLQVTGLWSSCWPILLILSIVCLVWMMVVVRGFMQREAPDLVKLIERRPWLELREPISIPGQEDAKTVEEIIKNLPFFNDLTEEELKNVAQAGSWISMGPKQSVFKKGDDGDGLYVVLKGTIRVHNSDEGGEDVELTSLGVGSFVGELSLLDGEPRSADVTTVEACDFFILDRETFLDLLSKSSQMMSHTLGGLSQSIRQGNQRLFEVSSKA